MLDALDRQGTGAGSDLGPTFRTRFNYPYLIVHRVDLHRVLMDACRAVPAIAFVS